MPTRDVLVWRFENRPEIAAKNDKNGKFRIVLMHSPDVALVGYL